MRKEEMFVRPGNTIPGLAIKNAAMQVEYKQRMKEKEKKNDDRENRTYIQKQIREYIQNGLEKSAIKEKILKDPIMSRFDYLEKQGINISTCVSNWIDTAIEKYRRNSGEKEDVR